MGSDNETVRKVRCCISRYEMISPGDLVVVAVSGGPDSVCLLDLLNTYRCDLDIELVAAHFDHRLRPGEDEAETRFVEDLASSMGLSFEAGRADPGMDRQNGSLEENARDARYRFLEQVRQMYGAHKIAVGHNLNDQAETVLMRLLRGSGPSGLAGIPPVREGCIIRPLIEVRRDEIESYLELRGLGYMTDSSNLERGYLRNRLRLDLLPRLKEYQPRIVERLGRTAEIMRMDEEWLDAKAGDWLGREADSGPQGDVRVPLPLFLGLDEAIRSRVVRRALRMAGGGLRRIGLRHWESINGIAAGERPQARVDLPNGLHVIKEYDTLIFTAEKQGGVEDFCYLLKGPGRSYLEALGCFITLEETTKEALPEGNDSPETAFLDAERLAYPLMVRNFRPGDRFIPLGMTGHKKIKDFFIDLKIPSGARARIPILTWGNDIVWVCGLRTDNRYRVNPGTRKVLKVALSGPP